MAANATFALNAALCFLRVRFTYCSCGRATYRSRTLASPPVSNPGSTVTDLERGEWATLWGFVPGQSRLTWEEMGGAEGYKGATVHCDIDASMTFAGKAVGTMTVTTGMAGSEPYIAFITL